jgi:hypothetical protein
VAVSDEAVLLSSSTATGSKLTAVMLDTGDVIELAEAEALWNMDIDGDVAVWWEGNAWDDGSSTWSDQRIYTFKLPDGPPVEVVDGSGSNINMPQIARPWVTWVNTMPWVDNPDEYYAERIEMARVDDDGAPTGAATVAVPLATAFAMGDSSWQYSLSHLMLAWENADAGAGYEAGTHVMEIELGTQGHIDDDAWRPSLWDTTLVYYKDGLWFTDLAAGGHHDLAADGDFATAGPDFAAYYRMAAGGSEIVVRAYDGSYEQVLGTNPDPPWFCPPISVSENYVAFTIGTDVYLFHWS